MGCSSSPPPAERTPTRSARRALTVTAPLYASLPVRPETVKKFSDAREYVRQVLAKKTNMTEDDATLTGDEIVRGFLYGDIMHINDAAQRETYERWMANPIWSAMVVNQLCVTLGEVIDVLLFLREVNTEAIAELREGS